jgi:predicted nucleic acid-binding protein
LIVADASIVLAFIMHGEVEPYADAAVAHLAREGAAVPGNFHSEIANGLLQAERRRRIDATKSAAALAEILELPFTVESPDPRVAIRLAREQGLIGYDAFYLAVALQLGLPLATVDSELRAAARSLDLEWKPPS